jgi:hypothetical protein
VLLVGVSLAVAAVPEGLPAILSVARWACGGWRRNTIVKRLSSVETLLSASVVCSDQTGTVTEDQRDPRGAPHLRQHPPVPALPAVLDVGEVLTMFLGVVPARGLGLHDTGARRRCRCSRRRSGGSTCSPAARWRWRWAAILWPRKAARRPTSALRASLRTSSSWPRRGGCRCRPARPTDASRRACRRTGSSPTPRGSQAGRKRAGSVW